MRQLIKQEFKKIFKKKYFLVLLLLLLGVSGYQTYTSYSNNYLGDNAIQNEEGVKLTGIDAIRYIDSERHKLAGIVDKKFIENYADEYVEKINTIIETESVIDEEKMIAVYGKNYKELFERAKNGNFSEDDYDLLYNIEIGWGENPETGEVFLETFYENTEKLSALSSIYNYANDYFYEDDFIQGYNNFFEDPSMYNPIQECIEGFLPFIEKEKYLASQDFNNTIEYSFLNIYYDSTVHKVDSRIFDYYNQQFMDAEPYFDSTIPNQLLVKNMSNAIGIMLVILLIIIVLSDIFSYDSQTKTDQIIESSPYGHKKLKVAKLITGICIALGIVVLQQILIFTICNIMLPIRNFSLTEGGAGSMFMNSTNLNNYIEPYSSVITTGVIMLLLGGLVTGMLTMFISYLSKNKFTTAIFMIILFFVLIFSIESFIFKDLSSSLLPYIPFYFMRFTIFHNFVQPLSYSIGIIPHTILFDNVVAVRDLVIIVWLALCVGMGSFISFVKVGEVKSK